MEMKTVKTVKKTKCGHAAKEGKKNVKKAGVFTSDNTIASVLAANKNARNVLMGFGMHCFGCPSAQMETLGEAAQAHGVDINLMLEKLNELDGDCACGCGCGIKGCKCS